MRENKTLSYSKNIIKAIRILDAGGVIAFPADTVWGIGAKLENLTAIRKIYKMKRRPASQPLQVLVASQKEAQKLGKFNQPALKLAQKHWPGALTLVVYKTKVVPKLVCGHTTKVGLRIPKHRSLLNLLRSCGPLAATSANLSGQKPAKNPKEIQEQLPQIDFILPGRSKNGKASKVIDATGHLKVLRS